MASTRRLHVHPPADTTIAAGIAAIRREQSLPDAFPAAVEAAAAQAAAHPRLPALDRTDLALVTIDPPGSRDLDQALHVERNGTGFRVSYAIADVAAFVAPGDPVDLEAHRRGATLYGADEKIPLHPRVLSEDAASLLPDQVRPALLWTLDVDGGGDCVAIDVRRARVRSRAQLDYDGVQAAIDGGSAEPMWEVLRAFGELRKQRERDRGGISLPLPEQEIRVDAGGRWSLEFRARQPVEDWNEQVSLLTGMAAAQLMVQGRIGLLRTLPKPQAWAIERLHRTAHALGIAWPETLPYAQFIDALDPAQPHHVAMMVAATTVLRGAGYAAFDGAVPAQPMHWGLAAQYAHATAPLRRLVDRYVGETCVALCAGQPVPDWVRGALPALPATMADADHRASQFEHAVLDLAETLVLSGRVGERFSGAIVEVRRDDPREGVVVLREPAIEAPLIGTQALPLGESVTVRLVAADTGTRKTRFALG